MYIRQYLLLNLQNTLLSVSTENSYENVNWALLGQHGMDQDKTHECINYFLKIHYTVWKCKLNRSLFGLNMVIRKSKRKKNMCMIWFDHLASKRGRGGGRREEKCRPFSRSAIEWVSDPRSRRRAQNPKKESESDSHHHLMSFSFFKPSRPKTPQEVVKAIRDSLLALDTKTVVEVKALEKVKVFTFIGLYYSWILDSLLIAYCNSLGIVLKLRIVYYFCFC